MTTIWERIAGPKIQTTYQKIRTEYGEEAYNLAHTVANVFIKQGKGTSRELAILGLADSVETGAVRMHRSSGHFLYKGLDGRDHKLVAGDCVMRELSTIAARMHMDTKGGSFQGRIMRWLLPKFLIAVEIERMSRVAHRTLLRREEKLARGDY